MEQLHCNMPTGRISWIIDVPIKVPIRRVYSPNMGEFLTAIMRWVHLSSAVTLVGGIVYARFVMIPSARSLSPDARTALGEKGARRFRPAVFTAMAGVVLSGICKDLVKTGHTARYSSLGGGKMLL